MSHAGVCRIRTGLTDMNLSVVLVAATLTFPKRLNKAQPCDDLLPLQLSDQVLEKYGPQAALTVLDSNLLLHIKQDN